MNKFANETEKSPYGLASQWSELHKGPLASFPARWEGELSDLVVYGEIPREINGTFYRIMVDPFYPPSAESYVPIEGDGNISAFRFKDGKVDLKVKYVDTDRLRLERQAGKRLFGLYRNPFTHHPCVRASVDSTANTNMVYWAGRLLALKESGLPYEIDPNTLETLKYDPFGQINAKTFSAHPKVDPYTNELVVFGYEAKGLATLDIVIYTLDEAGNAIDESWIKSPWGAFIHDCAVTKNWIILVLWPFESDYERLKAGGQHWTFRAERPVTFIVAPRRKSARPPPGWKSGEYRAYHWENCIAMHTGGAWEDEDGDIYLESSRVCYNVFPQFQENPQEWNSNSFKADYVRWKLDLRKPDSTKIDDPQVVLDQECEFPRIDERFLTSSYDKVFLNVILPQHDTPDKFIPIRLNGLAMVETQASKTTLFDPGPNCHVQEPTFIPRSDQAAEGDGWIIALVERVAENICELVVLDTNQFQKPIAVVRMPFRLMPQVHGNWVGNVKLQRRLTRDLRPIEVSNTGDLEYL